MSQHVSTDSLRKWFLEYTGSFSSVDPLIQFNLNLKKEHTLRVCDEITSIARAEKFSDMDLQIAQIIALLHDIGRFDQYTRYKTFSDKKSVDHAVLGISVIQESGVLQSLSSETRSLITDAILFHNRPSLPGGISDRTLLFAKLIRDADKLDIIHLLGPFFRGDGEKKRDAVTISLPDTPAISKEAIASVYSGSIVNFNDVHCINDFKVLQMAWVFDLNFSWSLKQYYKRKYLESLRDALPDTEEVRKVYAFMRERLERRLEDNR